MAKLTAPLFSLKASQKLGNALVYFSWKGLNCVRTYVIPANPKTTAQNTQRGYLTAAVSAIHAAQVLAANPLVALDTAAYSLLGSIEATPRTWFNTVCRQWIKQKVAGKLTAIFRGASTAIASSTSLNVRIHGDRIEDGAINDGDFKYGTTKTALINIQAATFDESPTVARATITGLTAGVKYYWQFVTAGTANYVGTKSGIYYGTPS